MMEPMKLTILLLFTATLAAQDFNVSVRRWTNWDYPVLIADALPRAPVDAKRDGVEVIVTTTTEAAAIEVTLTYKRDGKRFKEVRTIETGTTGCTPEPCRWAPLIFEVGVIDWDSIRVEAKEWSTKDE